MRLFYKTCKINYMRLKSVFALCVKYISLCDHFILSIGLMNPDCLITIVVKMFRELKIFLFDLCTHDFGYTTVLIFTEASL